jgi:hypothetical protein
VLPRVLGIGIVAIALLAGALALFAGRR